MNILALPNAFKGSLSAVRAAKTIQRALAQKHAVKAFPISDGGDGFLDFFCALDPDAQHVYLTAKNAFLKNKRTYFLLINKGETAVLETARICGLGSAKPHELDPLNASSYGVGQAILKAIQGGARTIYVGLGGVACNDGGAGMVQALGAKLLDKNGRELPPGAAPLAQLHQIDLTALKQHLKGVKIYAVADVTNPLLGPQGSARVFGPQKGATPQQVRQLEKALSVYARVAESTTRRPVAHTPGAGAAGAIAAGLYGLCGASFLCGADFLFKKAGFEKHYKWADLIITTEGKLDAQTFCGKAPLAVLQLARKYKKPVLFICGQVQDKIISHPLLRNAKLAALADFAPTLQEAQTHAAAYIRRVCKTL